MKSYLTNYLKRVLPKSNEIDCIVFKFSFYGGYALKVVINNYYTMIDNNYSIQIDNHELKECLTFLKDNNYIIHKHSVIKYNKLEVL